MVLVLVSLRPSLARIAHVPRTLGSSSRGTARQALCGEWTKPVITQDVPKQL